MRYLCADTRPDHDTICKFRRESVGAISESFLWVLRLAQALKLSKVGMTSVDGTKLDAAKVGSNANKHRNVRYDRAGDRIEQLEDDIVAFFDQAERADTREYEAGQQLPERLARRETLKAEL